MANDETVIIINDTCSICLLYIEQDTTDIKQVDCCKNKFHNSCYTKWINKNPTCPLCRSVHINPLFVVITTNSSDSTVSTETTETTENTVLITCISDCKLLYKICKIVIISCVVIFGGVVYCILTYGSKKVHV